MKEFQKESFLAGEGDQWYCRNKAALENISPIRLKHIEILKPYLKQNDTILEIGCADGVNLSLITNSTNCKGFGIDPSQKAIEDGKRKFPHLNLFVGTADELPFNNAQFNVVWFAGCLCWVDRTNLMKSVSEADRVCADKGFVVITDFDPVIPTRRVYHHRQGLYTYKMDYSSLFLANPAYSLAEKCSYSHHDTHFHNDPNERYATWVLHKSLQTAYVFDDPS